jgi:hypothetical protein
VYKDQTAMQAIWPQIAPLTVTLARIPMRRSIMKRMTVPHRAVPRRPNLSTKNQPHMFPKTISPERPTEVSKALEVLIPASCMKSTRDVLLAHSTNM